MQQKNERSARHTGEEIDWMIRRGEDRTEWERVRALASEETEASIDFEDEGVFDWSKAYAPSAPPVPPDSAPGAMPRVDSDILEWFRQRASGHEDELNAVLREYMAEQERKAS